MRRRLAYAAAGILWIAFPAAAENLTIHNCSSQSKYFRIYNYWDFFCAVPRYLGAAGTVEACGTRTFYCNGPGCKIDFENGQPFDCNSYYYQTQAPNVYYNGGGFLQIGQFSDAVWADLCDCPKSDLPLPPTYD